MEKTKKVVEVDNAQTKRGGLMYPPKPQDSTDQENKRFLSRLYTSKEEFVRRYKLIYYGKAKAAELYLLILIELEKAISENNIVSFKRLSNFIDYVNEIEDRITLRDYFDNSKNPIKNTNFIILACKFNRVKILYYLFGNDSKILSNLSTGIKRATILPTDEDEECHNTFYYAIRSGNLELLDTLIKKWPDNYFAVHPGELDEILSIAYEKLKLKNVPLTEKIEFFVENKLIDLRFYSDGCDKAPSTENNLINTKERIELVLKNINLLKADYLNTMEVDERFLFIATCIAKNIHVLKRLLKSTYNRLPWEEMEFCLVCFISFHIKQQEINLFYHATLDKVRILDHLQIFGQRLENEGNSIENTDTGKHKNLPKLKREKAVAEIINNYPEFEELYKDYQQIRDIYSLDRISDYIKLASSANPREMEGKLIITRALQVIGEHLKNTLESPKLSNTTSELLLLSLPKNTREIIKDLRDSLSHANSLSKRTEIEENTDIHFFTGIQNDIKIIGDVISDIIHNNKIKMIKILLKKIINSENLNELKGIARALNKDVLVKMISKNSKIMEHKLEKLVEGLSDNITDKTNYEKDLFNKIYEIFSSTKTKSANIERDYMASFSSIIAISNILNDYKINHNVIRGIKFLANKILENFVSQIEPDSLKEIAEITMKIYRNVLWRIQHDNKLVIIGRLTCEIFFIAAFGVGDIRWIEELREKLNEKGSFIPTQKQRRTFNLTEEKYYNQLTLKMVDLKSILNNRALNSELFEKVTSLKSNKKFQAALEMLVLDIMSILGSLKNYLENNSLFLDDNTPLLTGKCLRDHLAHDNALIDVLLSDSAIAVMLNAEKLISENVMENKKKIGKLVRKDLSKFQDQHVQSISDITNQERMFIALEEGNLEDLKNYIKKGADINARSIDSWTTLHFAAKGPSLEAIKFILDQNLSINAKDINGQSPLHIAAAHGRKNIVKLLLKETKLYVDNLDNSKKTPLHIAAQNGHKDIVKILLKNNANTNAQDIIMLSPLHYAIKNNHIDVVKILIEKEENVDIKEVMGGFTPLHLAAEDGHLDLVNFLLKNNANVNKKNDNGTIPLHTAALNGHTEVVNALIQKGADVNSKVLDGCTPLHYAIENGHEEIASNLIKHGANVNVADKSFNNTPLHYVAKDGYERIVKILLENKANTNVATVDGITPLHLAVQANHLEIVTALLKHGANINARDINQASPLYYAAESGHEEVAKLLIENNAMLNAKLNDNSTPLHVAALKGHKNVVDILINNKAEINARDSKGSTPLHLASMNGSINIIDLLIKNGAEVNVRTIDGITPLHAAALNGHEDSIVFLIESNAEFQTTTNYGLTPLHAAVMGGHKDVVNLLIKYKAQVNANTIESSTPLHLAVVAGHKEIVEILIANGANVDIGNKKQTLLLSAIGCNNKEIVKVLIANGANVNAEGGEPLLKAIFSGFRDIVEILLKNETYVNIKGPENVTPLHLAAKKGYKKLINALVTRGADVHALDVNNATPLHYAAIDGHDEAMEVLIAIGANVNAKSIEGNTPLHIAATLGHNNAVKVLLDNQVEISIKDNKDRTSLELAVANGHLQVVKMLLQYKKIDINSKGNDDRTLLHIASQENNLETVKYLVNEGSDINARNSFGSKPIHIAAREGYKSTVEFFLSKGVNINDPGTANQTSLHYAALKGHTEVVEYLIAQGADINVKDANGLTPMHIAAKFGHKNVIEILLQNGAVYKVVDKMYGKPLDTASDKGVINLLLTTEKLFEAVKCNSCVEIENYIKAGAFVNAKSTNSGTPLHYAAWKGYKETVNILLQNRANSNAIDNKGLTPLHYAAKFSHLIIVKALLFNGAIYNAISNSGKTPVDLTSDKKIINLFKLLSELFRSIENGNSKVIKDLNKIKDIDTIKAIMGARNRESKTIIVAAMHSNFKEVEQLKQISQGDVSTQINTALNFLEGGQYQKAFNIFKAVFEKRKEILGPDNPGTLDIQTKMALVLYKQGAYQEALNLLGEILRKQKEILGLGDKDTLSTRSTIALVLHRLEKNEEAFEIYQEVYQKQKELLGPDHLDTLNTYFHMALVLDRQGKYEEALTINRKVFEIRKVTLGILNPNTISAENNIAMVLANQKKYEEALPIYEKVFEKKEIILGINHCDTLRTLSNIAGVLFNQEKYNEAVKAYQKVLTIQKNILGLNNPDTLNTQYNLANVFFVRGEYISALKIYKESFERRKTVFGIYHPSILDISKKVEAINLIFKFKGSGVSEILQHLQKEINTAASKGDVQTIQHLLKNGADANDTDIEGRTPLHYAVSNGYICIVDLLLQNGADVTRVTHKGNTPLHTATSGNYVEIVEILLKHVSRDKLHDFINAKTVCSGTTSLHIAAKNGSLEIVRSLLKHGAIYNIENKKGKIPIDFSKDQNIFHLMKSVAELFEGAKNGNIKIIRRLEAIKPEDRIAVTHARNLEEKTLLHVASANGHKNIASKLLEMIKKPISNSQILH